jgi:translocation and assembly module TamB
MGGGLDRGLIDITRPAPVMGQQLETAEGNAWIRNLRVDDLRVRVGSNTWFLAEEARVELHGDLTINKARDATPIVGTLEGDRGQYTLVAGPLVRRFDIVAAEVRFIGTPEPDPFIDFTARRVIIDAAGREVNVDVRISGTLDRPNIGLASGDLAAMPESELLSFLLFGQPSFELGGELPGDQLLEQTFVGGFAELAALELERELGGVGLDIFQIRLGGAFGGLGTPTLVAGRQLADDVFLTVETGIGALFGETFALRLDWAFDRRSRARLALEPIHRGRTLRPGLTLPLTLRPPKQQLLLEVRRRWEW